MKINKIILLILVSLNILNANYIDNKMESKDPRVNNIMKYDKTIKGKNFGYELKKAINKIKFPKIIDKDTKIIKMTYDVNNRSLKHFYKINKFTGNKKSLKVSFLNNLCGNFITKRFLEHGTTYIYNIETYKNKKKENILINIEYKDCYTFN